MCFFLLHAPFHSRILESCRRPVKASSRQLDEAETALPSWIVDDTWRLNQLKTLTRCGQSASSTLQCVGMHSTLKYWTFLRCLPRAGPEGGAVRNVRQLVIHVNCMHYTVAYWSCSFGGELLERTAKRPHQASWLQNITQCITKSITKPSRC